MAYGDISSVVDTLVFATGGGVTPNIVHVSGKIYAIACKVSDGDGWIYTVSIEDNGQIQDTIVHSAEFEAEQANGIFFMHITGNVFAILTRISYSELRLRTVSISNDGLTISMIGTANIGALNSDNFTMCKVAAGVYAIVSSFTGADAGTVKTRAIADDGTIGSELGKAVCLVTGVDFPVIAKVGDTKYAVLHRKNDGTKEVRTITITDAGVVAAGSVDFLEVSSDTGNEWLWLCHAIGNVYVAAYRDAADDGWVASMIIDAVGAISDTVDDTLEYNVSNADSPHVVPIGLGYCAVMYQGILNRGKICSIKAETNGDIGDTVESSMDFDTITMKKTKILLVTGDTYVVAYADSSDNGAIKTLGISTPPVGGPAKHLMVMGIG